MCSLERKITIPNFTNQGQRTQGNGNNSETIKTFSINGSSSLEIDLSKRERICSLNVSGYNNDKIQHAFSISIPQDFKGMFKVLIGGGLDPGGISQRYDVQDVSTRYLRITLDGITDNKLYGITEIALYTYLSIPGNRLPPPADIPLLDDFEEYQRTNKTWSIIYTGYGSANVISTPEGKIFQIAPKVSTSINETHASLVQTTRSFSDFRMSMDVRTDKQLRQNDPPNMWEVAWIFFRYTDMFHYYWFLLKPNGIELGKKDCDNCTDPKDGQIALYTAPFPTLKIGEWSQWTIEAKGKSITVSVDGNIVINFEDHNVSKTLRTGRVAMYSEDAEISFDNFHLLQTDVKH